MAEKTFLTPEVLPVLPVRDTVLFPGAMLPLTVGRESSLALVGSLQGEEKLLGVVAQLDPRIEDPAAADLHKVGTLARVHKTRSEEHTSELQSRVDLVCRLLLEKKKNEEKTNGREKGE